MPASIRKNQRFTARLRAVPNNPGVYIMKDSEGEVLYVGKAANLKTRIRSYFAKSSGLPTRIQKLVATLNDFEFILTESDQEAVILECNLIKQYRPSFNIRLKDDKTYPFIKIDTKEAFPRVYVTRNPLDDGAKYFGPFASARSVHQTLSLLKKLFPYRSCTKNITGNEDRACLDYHIHRCVGPCIGAVGPEQYADVIEQVVLFLEGNTDQVTKAISRKMIQSANQLEFERAAVLRDQLSDIEKLGQGQRVLDLDSDHMDVVAAHGFLNETWVEIFFVRYGKVIGRDNFIMAGTQDCDFPTIFTAFIQQFYAVNPYIPPTILLQSEIQDHDLLESWLKSKKGSNVSLKVPRRGKKKRLVEMVRENAISGVEQLQLSRIDGDHIEDALEELQEALNLPTCPRRIECYDISNTQGSNAVGSMVVFENGQPKPSNYRKFKIDSIDGPNDYLMLREVLTRRFKRASGQNGKQIRQRQSATDSREQVWTTLPDLVVIDGGKGQLSTAVQVLLDLGVEGVPLSSLAKQNEELFRPEFAEPIVLAASSPALMLLQRARDEAHRFAITYHRQRRSKQSLKSALDSIDGIGPKRRMMLFRTFGSMDGIRAATVEELASVPGMTLSVAKHLKNYL